MKYGQDSADFDGGVQSLGKISVLVWPLAATSRGHHSTMVINHVQSLFLKKNKKKLFYTSFSFISLSSKSVLIGSLIYFSFNLHLVLLC